MAQRNRLDGTEDLARVRRPQNAFILYSNDNRRRLSTLHPHLDNRAISRMLGRAWMEMRADQQHSYWRRALQVRRTHRETHPGLCPLFITLSTENILIFQFIKLFVLRLLLQSGGGPKTKIGIKTTATNAKRKYNIRKSKPNSD